MIDFITDNYHLIGIAVTAIFMHVAFYLKYCKLSNSDNETIIILGCAIALFYPLLIATFIAAIVYRLIKHLCKGKIVPSK